MLVGFLGHFVALPFADLTLISCNSSSAVLMNVYIANKYLGERFVPKYDLTAMAFVVAGTLTILLLSNKEQQIFTTPTILALLTTPRSLVYFGITVAGMISVPFWVPRMLKALRRFETACEKWDDMFAENNSG